jgi:hypothetical protein
MNRSFYFTLSIWLLSGFSCFAQPRTESGVETAMRKYDRLILNTNSDSIAKLYSPDGELGNMAAGRDSIRNFLNRFNNYKVLMQDSKTSFITINRDTAFQTGTYYQKVIVPSGDTVSVKGIFNVKWIWTKSVWQIKRMDTQSSN